MSKYGPLADHLRSHGGEACSLTLVEIERIIGCPLPASARTHRSWWGNDRTHPQARAWMGAGFGAEPTPRRIEPVVFRPVRSQPAPPTPPVPSGPTQVVVRNLDRDVVAALKRRAQRAGRSQPAPPTPPVPSGPTQVVVRNLDRDVVAALKRRAQRAGRSLERELRAILSRAARPSRDELVAEASRIRAMTSAPLPDSTELIREDRARR